MTLINELLNVDIGNGSATKLKLNPKDICAQFFIPLEAAALSFNVCVTTFKRILRELNCLRWPFRTVNSKVKQLIQSPGFQLDSINESQLERIVNDISYKIDALEKVFTKSMIRSALMSSWLPAIVQNLSDAKHQTCLKEKKTTPADLRFFPAANSTSVLGKRLPASSFEEPASKRPASNYQFEFGRCPFTGIPQIQNWKRENSLN